MKINIYSICLLWCILLFSCGKKDLEIAPRNEIPSDIAIENTNLMLTGLYSLIGSGGVRNSQEGALYGTDLILIPDLLAGEQYMNWAGTFSTYRQILNKRMVSTNSIVSRIWRKAYMAINLSNALIENSPGNDTYKAHALFVRGIMHFELVRLYAKQFDPTTASIDLGVPILLSSSPTFESVQMPSRASVEEVYIQIIKDLISAEELLPDNNDEFITKAVIKSFLTRVYLQQGDYPSALNQANLIIESSQFSIAPKLTDVFNTNVSTERIFAIAQTQNNNVGTANDGLTTFYGCDPSIPASTGRGDVNISKAFVARYDSMDVRRLDLIYEGTCGKGSVSSGKWKDPYKDIPVVRLAEMILTRAECNFRLGSAVGAAPLEDLNTIRLRANAKSYIAIDLDSILIERELELAFEGVRIHDKRRTNAFFETEQKDASFLKTFYRAEKFVLPIPQVEMNSNKNLVQNSGY